MKSGIRTMIARTLTLAGLLAVTVIHAQETDLQKQVFRKPNELSVRYSNLTGYGMAYQRNFLTNYYLRTTAWMKYYQFERGTRQMAVYELENDNTYNFGLDIQRNIISENRYRVSAFLGGGYAVREKNQLTYTDVVANLHPAGKDQTLYTVGLGGIIEYYFVSNVSMDLGVSYKFDYNREESRLETTKETGLGTVVGLNIGF